MEAETGRVAGQKRAGGEKPEEEGGKFLLWGEKDPGFLECVFQIFFCFSSDISGLERRFFILTLLFREILLRRRRQKNAMLLFSIFPSSPLGVD